MDPNNSESSEYVIDFTKKQKLRGVVGSKPQPKLAKLTGNKAAGIALATLGAAGSLGLLAPKIGGGNENNANTVLNPKVAEASEPEITQSSKGIFDTIFHDLDNTQKTETRNYVDELKNRISTKSNYVSAHQVIPLKYQDQIVQTAKAYGISPEALIGIISVENGGGEDVENATSKALGVAQFLPDTAREYGLLVNSEFDERKNPSKSIAAAGKYLEIHKNLFGGDEGIAIWSYHAGVGNVFQA